MERAKACRKENAWENLIDEIEGAVDGSDENH